MIELVEKGHDEALHEVRSEETWQPNQALWAAVSARDDEAFVNALQVPGVNPDAVFPVTRRLDRKDALSTWVRTGLAPGCWSCGLFAATNHLSRKVRYARLLGSAGDLRDERAGLDALRDALGRRDIALPVYTLLRLERLRDP